MKYKRDIQLALGLSLMMLDNGHCLCQVRRTSYQKSA
jgi:hypothetical protein